MHNPVTAEEAQVPNVVYEVGGMAPNRGYWIGRKLKKLFMAASDLAPSSNCDQVQPGQVRISDLEVRQCGR